MKTGTWCPMCGPGVRVDEDGCCCQCGSTATGDGADRALWLAGENERLWMILEAIESGLWGLRKIREKNEKREEEKHHEEGD